MALIQRVRKTDLARDTRRVISSVVRGQPAVVESHGEPEVAIIDIVDFRIVRAVMRTYAQQPAVDVEAGLSDAALAEVSEPQERYYRVLAHYLAGAISLARAAELLGLSWLDLRTRCLRLDVPLRTAPADVDEARAEAEAAEAWT